jgi:hypothetical protein
MEATGADMRVRGARADEFIHVLKPVFQKKSAQILR